MTDSDARQTRAAARIALQDRVRRGKQAAVYGILANVSLAAFKLVAGVVGHSGALVADAIESSADVASSTIVLGGLSVAERDADESYPFGYGKAETLAGAVVALMLIGAACGIFVQAIHEIRTPHDAPAWWTLLVLVVVIALKGGLTQWVRGIASQIDSAAVKGDAWHHASDALTSAAAFVGISVALVGGRGWEAADDWAALVAACVIAANGVSLLRPSMADLMDRSAEEAVITAMRTSAESVQGVTIVEKLAVRRVGLGYRAIIHVQAHPEMSLREAHALGARVTREIHQRVSQAQSVIVHMEPYEDDPSS
ncbi:MAG: cation diffusion facilitator family transporter [Vicinamibacterales bacterium]